MKREINIQIEPQAIIALVEGKKLSINDNGVSINIIPKDWSVVIRREELNEIKKTAYNNGVIEIIDLIEKSNKTEEDKINGFIRIQEAKKQAIKNLTNK